MHPSATFPLAISICLKLVMFNFINSSLKFVWPQEPYHVNANKIPSEGSR